MCLLFIIISEVREGERRKRKRRQKERVRNMKSKPRQANDDLKSNKLILFSSPPLGL
jgi:hypothetical protein